MLRSSRPKIGIFDRIDQKLVCFDRLDQKLVCFEGYHFTTASEKTVLRLSMCNIIVDHLIHDEQLSIDLSIAFLFFETRVIRRIRFPYGLYSG